MKPSPSSRLFVVHLDPRDQPVFSRRLAFLGRVQPLLGSDVLLLSLSGGTEAAKAAWRRVQDVLGTAGTVQPVLLDEDGEPHYPTGELSVRFWQVPGAQELQRFANEHRLRLLRRNEFVPQQVVFELIDSSATFLPELIEQIEKEEGAKAVWANTLSRYQKAQTS